MTRGQLVKINGRDVRLPEDACLEGPAVGEYLRLPPEMGGSNAVLRVRRGAPRGAAVTLRHLLTHQAGLPGSAVFDGAQDDAALAWRVAALRDVALTRAPGAGYEYADDGYAVAGLVVQEVTGRPYERVVEEGLFVPLGMTGSTFDPAAPGPRGWPRATPSAGASSGPSRPCRAGAWPPPAWPSPRRATPAATSWPSSTAAPWVARASSRRPRSAPCGRPSPRPAGA